MVFPGATLHGVVFWFFWPTAGSESECELRTLSAVFQFPCQTTRPPATARLIIRLLEIPTRPSANHAEARRSDRTVFAWINVPADHAGILSEDSRCGGCKTHAGASCSSTMARLPLYPRCGSHYFHRQPSIRSPDPESRCRRRRTTRILAALHGDNFCQN
jgi:hypothetical protein